MFPVTASARLSKFRIRSIWALHEHDDPRVGRSADREVGTLDVVREVPRAALGLGVTDVRPRADDAVGKDVVVAAVVRTLGAADVALAPDERRSGLALDVALERA